MVQQLGPLRLGSLIVDLFPVPPADDQAAGLQLLQVVGHRRGAHLHHGGEVDDALFTVAQQPKNPDAAAVPQLFEDVSHCLEIVHAGHLFQLPLHGLSMVVGQLLFFHRLSLLLVLYSTTPRAILEERKYAAPHWPNRKEFLPNRKILSLPR